MTEIWKPVAGHDGYEVSNLGRVRSLDREWRQGSKWGTTYTYRKKGKMLRPGSASNDYPTVSIGRRNTRTVHSLVAEAFIGPCPAGQEVRHKDGDRANPRDSNLCYGTRLDNIKDAQRHGTACRGSNHPAATIDEKEAKAILDARGTAPARELARRFGVTINVVYLIHARQSWRHV
jgi:hypothetical protein